MRVLVTGGAGFIGSNLVHQLILDGHQVVVLDDFSSGYKSNIENLNVSEIFEGDIRDSKTVKEAMKGVEVVFHLAASVGNKRSIDFPLIDADINVMGTLCVLEEARKVGVRKIVASSSAGIFGELKTIPIKEDHQIDPDSPYGSSKLCMEKECLSYAKVFDIEAVCLRYFNVYGPNQRFDAYGNVIPIFAFKMLRGEPITIFGDGEQTRDFINVKDVVQANIKAAMSIGISGAFNTGSGTRIKINSLVEMMQEVSGISAAIEYSAPRPGDVKHSLADITLAKEILKFHPEIEFKHGLQEYMGWAKSELLSKQ
jgi:nucleoside-diphosphate-sugar epimerase